MEKTPHQTEECHLSVFSVKFAQCYFCYFFTSSLPSYLKCTIEGMTSAQSLKGPREKSNNKIPSGYPHFPITSIPHTNTDEIELPRIQQLVLHQWNKIVLSFSTLHTVKEHFLTFLPLNWYSPSAAGFISRKTFKNAYCTYSPSNILSISPLNLAFVTELTTTLGDYKNWLSQKPHTSIIWTYNEELLGNSKEHSIWDSL